MRLLLVQQFLSGPSAPGPAQPRALLRRLAAAGCDVTVLSCAYNVYSEQEEADEEILSDAGGRARICRIRVPRDLRRSLSRRMLSYGAFAAAALARGARLERPDVVLGSIQPLFTGVAARALAAFWEVPFVLEVRDLWPDALVVRRVLRPWQAEPLFRMARSLYHGAERVVSLTPGIRQELLSAGVSPGRIDVFPNAFDPATAIPEAGARERVRREMGWDGSFVAVYTGTHTEVTALDTIVRAADRLRGREDVRIDLFGSGQAKPGLVDLARRLGLTNVMFHEPVPKSRVKDLLAGADVGLMSLFRSPLAHIYFENKLIDYLGAARPVVAAMDGIQGEVLRAAGAGICVPSHDDEGLAQALASLAGDRKEAERMGLRGRQHVEGHLLQSTVLDRYVAMLEAVARGEAEGLEPFSPFA